MKVFGHLGGILLVSSLFMASCEKPEQSVLLPPKTGSEHAVVSMGEDYTDQIFFDLETKSTVYTSAINSWDLCFEASATGYHLFLNGGKGVYVYNTHKTDITDVYEVPKIKDNEWQFDQACGLPDSTGIGEWMSSGLSKKEVYIVKLDPTYYPDTFKKIQLIAVSDEQYVMLYGDLRKPESKMITIPKNANYNYMYFCFSENSVVTPEPPKNTWDIVFTRYRYNYHYLNNFSYPVTGVLTNPYSTTAAKDTITAYETIKSENLLKMKFSDHRDIIGFDWKVFDFDQRYGGTTQYKVDKKKIYIIKTRRDQYYKLRFLDFYQQGVKGNPSFEYERLQ